MNDWQTVRQASEKTGVARISISRWLKLGLLRGKPTTVGHMAATLVSIPELRKVAKNRKPGRPRKSK